MQGMEQLGFTGAWQVMKMVETISRGWSHSGCFSGTELRSQTGYNIRWFLNDLKRSCYYYYNSTGRIIRPVTYCVIQTMNTKHMMFYSYLHKRNQQQSEVSFMGKWNCDHRNWQKKLTSGRCHARNLTHVLSQHSYKFNFFNELFNHALYQICLEFGAPWSRDW